MPAILILDDQATSRQLLRKLLESTEPDAQVVGFADGHEALEWLRHEPVDLVLADYSMPAMDGLTFTRRFRRLPQHRDVPLIFVTISDEKEVRLDALEAGATDFLNKPVDHYELQARSSNLLKLRRYQLNLKDRAADLESRLAKATTSSTRQASAAAKLLLGVNGLVEAEVYTDRLRRARVGAQVAQTMGASAAIAEVSGMVIALAQMIIETDQSDQLTRLLSESESDVVVRAHRLATGELDSDDPDLRLYYVTGVIENASTISEASSHPIDWNSVEQGCRAELPAEMLRAVLDAAEAIESFYL